jgi:hypothetical protein
MRAAFHDPNSLRARATLEALARDLECSPGRGRVAAGRSHRDAHRHPPRRAAHPGTHAAVDERDRVDDRDRSGPLDQCEALAGRADGAALVRGRDARSDETVPASQRLPAPAYPPCRPRCPLPRDCHTARIRSEQRGGRIPLTGPPPKFRSAGHPLSSASSATASFSRGFSAIPAGACSGSRSPRARPRARAR